ncbi:hypothetical protein [Haloarchaeobius litoreus]|uniref:Tat (Twin-arginine translocation) pathway signal sequence n=1 Tax=Haloarchaeobius litoreus TaxID=755306 RepID=A0ABD6DMI9_9EURY|nr:hypothetical protein [Haloarchaeobius litoreus]
MVPDIPSLTRRRLLGGVAGIGALGTSVTVGLGMTEPTALPDSVTDLASRHYPTPPEATTHWRPTVTEEHAAFAVDRLAETTDRAESLWSGFDSERRFVGDGGWLEDAESALRSGNYHEALWQATYGLQFAGEDLGRARWEAGRGDLQALATRGTELQERVGQVAGELAPYRVSDPATDLAWYLEIEQEALVAEQLADLRGFEDATNGVDDEDGPETSGVEARSVGELTANLLQAEVHVESAERFLQHLDGRLGNDSQPYSQQLQAATDAFRTSLEDTPTREEALARQGLGDSEQDDLYAFAHRRLARWCIPATAPSPWTVDVDRELRVATAVGFSTGVAKARAYEHAVDKLVVDEGQTGFDSGHLIAEKRRARSTYQSVIGGDPPPLLTRQASRAIEDLQVADVDGGGDGNWSLGHERVQAYCYALIGRLKLQEYPDLFETIIEGP